MRQLAGITLLWLVGIKYRLGLSSVPLHNGLPHRFSQKWQLRVCKWNFRVCKMLLLMKILMKMKESGCFGVCILLNCPCKTGVHRWLANTMGSRDQWEFPPFFRPQWKSLCTALRVGICLSLVLFKECLPLGLCKGTVKESRKTVEIPAGYVKP